MPSKCLPHLHAGMGAVHVRRRSTTGSRAFLAALLASSCLFATSARATDSTWVGGNAADPNEWVEPLNWSGAAQPDNTATFDNTATTNSVLNDNGVVFINQITFAATASTFAIGIDNPFLIQGTGIVNLSGTLQAFTVSDTLIFQNSATVLGGNVTINDNNFVNFQNSSNAGSANIVNNSNLEFDATSSAGSATISSAGLTTFFNSADAGNANITNSGELDFLETSSAASSNIVNTGTVNFTISSTAANATIDNQAGGTLDFHNSATAANAAITNETGATLSFNDSATAGNADITNSIGGGGDIEFANASSAANSSIVNDGTINFHGTSTAANAVITGSIGGAGTITFDDSTTADHASIDFNGSTSAFTFNNNSTAANATITIVSGTVSSFNDSASAGNAAITFGAGAFLTGILEFHGSSTAQNATITLTSPSNLGFFDSSSGGNARVISQSIVNNIDISGLTTAGTTLGSIEGTGQLELGSKQLTVGGNNLSTTFAGVIQDGGGSGGVGGSLAKTGTGTFTLSGANTYTGFTDVLQGTLQAGAANTFSAASDVVISPGATLDLNGFSQTIASLSGSGFVTLGAGSTLTTNGDNAVTTYSGVISGNGGLTKIGTNPLTLSGANTYSGFTNVNAGTLQAGALNAFSATSDVVVAGGATLDLNNFNQTIASLSGAGNVTLGSATLTTNGLNGSTTFSGVISGSGGLTKTGAGALTLSGNNTYSGPTTVSAGTLQAGASSAFSPTSDVTVASGATLDVNNLTETIGSLAGAGNVTLGASGQLSTNNPVTTTFSGVISGGSASLFRLVGASMTLTGTNTLSGTVIINPGSTLHAGIANTIANANLILVNAAVFDLNNFNQTIGTLQAAGPTEQITLGSATLTTNSAASSTFAGVISGTGGLTKAGVGTLKLSNHNTYTGPTTINGGTLQTGIANALSAATDVTVASGATFDLNNFSQTIGSLSGAGNVTLGGFGTATLSTNADNASTTFSGVISGTGGLTKIGTGTLILTGANTYSGVTLVNGGVLDVNGSIANSAVTVNQTGTLKGNGTVGSLSVGNGATVAPGNSIGTLHVAGNVSFGPSSVYQVETNAAGQSDLIVAGGSATLTGGIVQVLAQPGAYAATTVYPILTATGGVTGIFAGVTSNNPLLFPTLSYKPGEVDLTLTLVNLAGEAQTPNQVATANAIQAALGGTLFNAVVPLPAAAARQAFDATSGEIHASMRSVMLESSDTLRQGVLDHLHDREHKTGGGLWGRLFGSWGAIGSDGNAATLNTNYSGVTVGMDAPVSDDFLLGGAGGYGQLQGFIGQSRGSSLVSDTFHAELYASFTHGPFSLNGAAIGSLGTLRTDRAVRFQGFSDRDTTKQYGRTTQLFAEAAWDCPLGDFDIQPFLNGGWIEANTGAFSEAGGVAALSGTKGSSDETFMTLGTRLATDVTLANGGIITPNATLGWLHGFRNLTPQRFLTFEATSTSFTVLGVPLDEDQAVIDLAISAQPIRGLTASIGYDGILSGHVRDNGLHASLMWAF